MHYAQRVLRIKVTGEPYLGTETANTLEFGGISIKTDGIRFTLTATSLGVPRAEAEIDRADVPRALVFLYKHCWQAQRVLQLEEIGEFIHGEQTN